MTEIAFGCPTDVRRVPSSWSTASLSPRPTQRAQPSAAASVTRTISSARLRSGAEPSPASMPTILDGLGATTRRRLRSHALGGLDADEIEAACNHDAGRPAEGQPEGLLL